ncbi:MAG: YncE family protein [Acidobacteriota bacterium]|nr:YncE family protein [Acidobacteriota bacterium]
MRRMRMALMPLAVVLLAGALPATAQAKWDVTKTVNIGGEGGWDYLTVDPPAHRLFVTRSTHTMVIDGATGKVLGDIPGQKRSHGTAIVRSVNRGFITDGGGDGAIVIFDLKTYAVLGKLATMPDSDGIIYDRAMNLILAVSGDGGALMTFKPDIDPKNGKIDPPIDLGGKPEFLAADGTGKAYVNLENKDLVAVVDLKTRKVIARWPVAPGGHPVGMALNRRTHRLFIGCRNPQKLIVMSTEDGKILAALPIGAGVDATKISGGQAFASCGDGSLIVAGEKDGKYEVEQVVKTPLGARTMGVDPTTHTIYMPTAEFEAPAPGAAGRRPRPKPDTFMIVEVGRSAAQ